jgi:citrate lyase beta subunit
MGVTHKTDRQGSLTFTFQLARSLCIVSAAALAVQAIDGVHLDFPRVVISLEGQMVDKPHLVHARRILDLMARRESV